MAMYSSSFYVTISNPLVRFHSPCLGYFLVQLTDAHSGIRIEVVVATQLFRYIFYH